MSTVTTALVVVACVIAGVGLLVVLAVCLFGEWFRRGGNG